MSEPSVIDDLIILGRSVPSEIKNGRRPICIGGYSPTHGFIRLYPTFWQFPIKRWSIVEVPVERSRKPRYDGRPESWKIRGERHSAKKLLEKIRVVGEVKRKDWSRLLEDLVEPCVNNIMEDDRSLGIVKPKEILAGYYADNEGYRKYKQATINGSFKVQAKQDFEFEPRIRYVCQDCKVKRGYHDQQLLEWGAYEWNRKHPDEIDKVFENIHLFDEDYEKYFLVGNQFLYPSSFMVVSVLRYKKEWKHG